MNATGSFQLVLGGTKLDEGMSPVMDLTWDKKNRRRFTEDADAEQVLRILCTLTFFPRQAVSASSGGGGFEFGDGFEELGDEGIGLEALGLALEVKQDPMAQGGIGGAADVLEADL